MENEEQSLPSPEQGPHTQRVQYNQIAARIPEEVSRGVFATGVLVMQGKHEFVLDFVSTMARPHRVAARLILPLPILGSVLEALRNNIEKYEDRFGGLPGQPDDEVGGALADKVDDPAEMKAGKKDSEMAGGISQGAGGQLGGITGPPLEPYAQESMGQPKPTPKPPSPEEIYDQLKLPDDVVVGAYANGVMISHSQGEFCLDFVMRAYPRAVVTCRVFLSAMQGGKLERTLTHSWDQLKAKLDQQRRPPESPPESPQEFPGPDSSPLPDDDDETKWV